MDLSTLKSAEYSISMSEKSLQLSVFFSWPCISVVASLTNEKSVAEAYCRSGVQTDIWKREGDCN